MSINDQCISMKDNGRQGRSQTNRYRYRWGGNSPEKPAQLKNKLKTRIYIELAKGIKLEHFGRPA